MSAIVEAVASCRNALPVCLGPKWSENPDRLVSLNEVLAVLAYDYVRIGITLQHIEVALGAQRHLSRKGALAQNVSPEDSKVIVGHCDDILQHCIAVEMSHTADVIKHWQKQFSSRTVDHTEALCCIDEIKRSIKIELGSTQFLYPPKHRVLRFDQYYGPAEDAQLAGIFPIANRNIKAGSRCYLCAEYTATVFHAMRAVEKSLEALAATFAVDFDKRNWHNVIADIEKKIKDLGTGAQPPQRALLDSSSRCAAQFRYIKDAWRNHVMHGRTEYGEEDSLKVLEHSRELVLEVSAFLTEV